MYAEGRKEGGGDEVCIRVCVCLEIGAIDAANQWERETGFEQLSLLMTSHE